MPNDDDGKIEALLVELWQRHLPTLRERLDLLDRAGAAAASGTLPETQCAEALSIAHKLSGNLGMFGYTEGSQIASEIEQILKAPTPETLPRLAGLTTQLRQSLAAGL